MTEQKAGAAKHSADYREREKKKAAKLDIEKVFFNMPAGIKAVLAAEIERHGWFAQDHDEWAR
ncbi:hypothetical protein [Pseudomonas peradeniyensis]|uniref:hypothetical protein n=1 Tax=Pseudomonas peradeniyensis TaxID=2745488 RepID=UPI001CED5D3F|nr:hypothetical protein [Pseudomonas peradeniyensis]